MILKIEISREFLANLEVQLCIYLSGRRYVSEQDPVSGLRVFDFDWNRERSLPSGTELSYTVDTTLICCKTTQSQLHVWIDAWANSVL